MRERINTFISFSRIFHFLRANTVNGRTESVSLTTTLRRAAIEKVLATLRTANDAILFFI